MPINKVQFTQEGLDKLKKEHQELKDTKHQKAIERLHLARSMGDLSENSEYTAAKEDLAFIEGRIRVLVELMKNAEIIEKSNSDESIDIGNKVTVEVNGARNEFQIVGEYEANPMEKKLSTTSPIGRALLGKKVDDNIEIQIPDGKITYKIISISK